jgi:hypothetical protein
MTVLLFRFAVCCASLPSRLDAMPCRDDQDSQSPIPEEAVFGAVSLLLDTYPALVTDPIFAAEDGGLEGCALGIGDTPREGKGEIFLGCDHAVEVAASSYLVSFSSL